jgi:2-dehydro-3-deoxygluconokinase
MNPVGEKRSIVCFGECMIELSSGTAPGEWRMSFGGDAANVAIYCARQGIGVSFLSAVGTDPYSAKMLDFLRDEGVSCDLVLRHPDRLPGLYAIRTDDRGERSFTYWRDRSAARDLFGLPSAVDIMAVAAEARLLYFSGITLSLFDGSELDRVVDLARKVRENGGEVAFDSNYRPRGWASPEVARAAFAAIAPMCSIVLPTFEDERLLFGDQTPQETLARWGDAGAAVVAVKLGEEGALVSRGSEKWTHICCPARKTALDTTGAGDSFNAAFLCSLLLGVDPAAAALAGNKLAGEVVMHPGAIMPV